MARYNLVNIGTYYFTKDGLVTGKPCRVNVVGLDSLLLSKTGKVDYDAEGNAYVFMVDRKTTTIRIEVDYMLKDVFEDIVDAIDSVIDTESALTLGVVGDLGTYTLSVVPKFPKPITLTGKFDNERIDGIVFEFVTVE